MNKENSIIWFRLDLRLNDNQALYEACKYDKKLIPIYIYNDNGPLECQYGKATKLWLHNSLNLLNLSLNNKLNFYNGEPYKVIDILLKKYNINAVFFNKCYEPWKILEAENVKNILKTNNIIYKEYNSNLIHNPQDIKNNKNEYYKIFSAFKKKILETKKRELYPTININNYDFIKDNNSVQLDDLRLRENLSWSIKIEKYWFFGENNAIKKFNNFKEEKLQNYEHERNFPYKLQTSKLSPHVHFGEISPLFIWNNIKKLKNNDDFLNEILWREFSYYLLYYYQDIYTKNFKKKFDNFPWKNNNNFFDLWKNGKTGYPIIDAGMRELWETGYMHNRVRMIVASFLVKNLMIHWHKGRNWFWDTLLDADLASNSLNWQWIAGSGTDQYYRIFNPIIQGSKFDPEGFYIRKFIPELKLLPNKYLFSPWMAPKNILEQSNIILGKTYPNPIIDINLSRLKAIESFKNLNK